MFHNFTVTFLKNITKNLLKMESLKIVNTQRYAGTSILDNESERLVWIDMEMTGLDIDKDQIMEIACIITDSKLNIVAESPNLIIHQPQAILSNMNDWCQKQHRKTGLVDACLNSQTSLKTAEEIILNFLKQHASPKISQLAGNSVYMDRYFLMKHMPQVHEYLHYRIIDVSSIKELCRIWNLSIYQQRPKKEFSHRALSDIKESVKELKWYKENLFKL